MHVMLDQVYSLESKIVTGLILPPVIQEFDFEGPFLKLGQNIGLLVGAAFWGIGSDVWGRKYVRIRLQLKKLKSRLARISFNITLLITGVFATVAGTSSSSTALISLVAVWSIGVGGNIPVDSAIFLGELTTANYETRELCSE